MSAQHLHVVRDAGKEKRAAELIAAVRRVGQDVAKRAEEIDAAGKMPAELYDALEATMVFRALLPEEYGGLDLPLARVNDAVAEGARANGSLGWLLMVGT